MAGLAMIALALLVMLGLGKITRVEASCVEDADWPTKPCLDTPPYDREYLRKTWDEYYEMKGSDWMEIKKAEMDQAIRDGTLKQWVEYQSGPNNFANFNVYFYYYLNGQAPDINDYDAITKDSNALVISYWYISLAGIAFIAAITGIASIAGVLAVRKFRNLHKTN